MLVGIFGLHDVTLKELLNCLPNGLLWQLKMCFVIYTMVYVRKESLQKLLLAAALGFCLTGQFL